MTEPPRHLEPSTRDLINAAHAPTWWEQPNSERLKANRELLERLCDQLAAGKVDRDLAFYFRAMFKQILVSPNPGKDAGRMLGLMRRKGSPADPEIDDRNLAIAVAMQCLVDTGMNQEDARDEVARSYPGEAGDDIEGRHLSIETVRDAYRTHKNAAKAALALKFESLLHDYLKQYFAALRWEDDGGSIGSHEPR